MNIWSSSLSNSSIASVIFLFFVSLVFIFSQRVSSIRSSFSLVFEFEEIISTKTKQRGWRIVNCPSEMTHPIILWITKKEKFDIGIYFYDFRGFIGTCLEISSIFQIFGQNILYRQKWMYHVLYPAWKLASEIWLRWGFKLSIALNIIIQSDRQHDYQFENLPESAVIMCEVSRKIATFYSEIGFHWLFGPRYQLFS